MARQAREKFKVYKGVFDNFTIRTLIELAKKALFLEETLSPVKIGKEANVFSALNAKARKRVCIKIYRLETANFNRMYGYICSDPRFAGLTHKRRKVILAWVQREFRNLQIANAARIKAPKPIKFLNNVLIMSFIGGSKAAPMLKDAPPKKPEEFYRQVTSAMKALYNKGFTHGDLSPFNILNNRQMAYIIDFSHATSYTNPRFFELLRRDAKNIAEYFSNLGVKTSTEEILKEIKK